MIDFFLFLLLLPYDRQCIEYVVCYNIMFLDCICCAFVFVLCYVMLNYKKIPIGTILVIFTRFKYLTK